MGFQNSRFHWETREKALLSLMLLSMVSFFGAFCWVWAAAPAVKTQPVKAQGHAAVKKSPVVASSDAHWRWLKGQTRCQGKVVQKFSAQDAGDSPRSDPSTVVNRLHPMVSRYESQLCVETQSGIRYRRSLEWVKLKNGLVFSVENSGYESVALSFRFVLPTETRPFTDKPYWLGRSIALYQGLMPVIQKDDQPMVRDAIVMMQKHQKLKDPLALENTVLDNSQEIATRVFWNEMRSVPQGGRSFVLAVSIGPL